MTLKELSSEICSLGFDSYSKLDMTLVFAARRALTSIFSELHVTEEAKLFVASHKPTTKVKRLCHKGGGAEALPLSGKAYAMTVSGRGCVTITDGFDSFSINFNSDSKLIRGFLKQGGRAVFSGDYSYDVYNVVTYDDVFGPEVSSIPDGDGFIKIDARKTIENFGGFASAAHDEFGKVVKSAILTDGTIKLPDDFCGELNLRYKKTPSLPTLTSPDEEIDIPDEYAMLLPLLTAFYVLLDDEPEKAEIYKSAYSEARNCIKKGAYSLACAGYADVNGWGR